MGTRLIEKIFFFCILGLLPLFSQKVFSQEVPLDGALSALTNLLRYKVQVIPFKKSKNKHEADLPLIFDSSRGKVPKQCHACFFQDASQCEDAKTKKACENQSSYCGWTEAQIPSCMHNTKRSCFHECEDRKALNGRFCIAADRRRVSEVVKVFEAKACPKDLSTKFTFFEHSRGTLGLTEQIRYFVRNFGSCTLDSVSCNNAGDLWQMYETLAGIQASCPGANLRVHAAQCVIRGNSIAQCNELNQRAVFEVLQGECHVAFNLCSEREICAEKDELAKYCIKSGGAMGCKRCPKGETSWKMADNSLCERKTGVVMPKKARYSVDYTPTQYACKAMCKCEKQFSEITFPFGTMIEPDKFDKLTTQMKNFAQGACFRKCKHSKYRMDYYQNEKGLFQASCKLIKEATFQSGKIIPLRGADRPINLGPGNSHY